MNTWNDEIQGMHLTLRKLNVDEEQKWLDMVESCYADKGTSRKVFEQHLKRTPPDERVLLAILDQGKIIMNWMIICYV